MIVSKTGNVTPETIWKLHTESANNVLVSSYDTLTAFVLQHMQHLAYYIFACASAVM